MVRHTGGAAGPGRLGALGAGCPAAGAQGGRWEQLLALPHPHTSHVNSTWAAAAAPRGLSEMKPTAAFVSPASRLVGDTNTVFGVAV